MMPQAAQVANAARRILTYAGRLVVLDFASPAWGPFGSALRIWLRRHRVDVSRSYLAEIEAGFRSVTVRPMLGGYCFLAVATDRIEKD